MSRPKVKYGAFSRRDFVKAGTAGFASAVILSSFGGRLNAATTSFDYYISTNGSDSNPGTEASPWAITALNTKRATYAGKRVGLLDGNYNLSAMNAYNGATAPGPYPILQIAAGNSGAQTVIQSVNPRRAVLNLKSSGGVRNQKCAIGQYGPNGGENGYVTLDGLTVTGGGLWLAVFTGADPADYARYSPSVVVQNCLFNDNLLPVQDNAPAIWLDTCINPIIRNNKFHDLYASGMTEGACAIMLLGVRGLIAEHNECYNTHTFIHDKHQNGSGYPCNGNIARYNYIHDIDMVAFLGWDTEYASSSKAGTYLDSSIHNNLMVGCGSAWGVKISSPTRMNVSFYNNTFVLTKALPGDNGVVCGPSASVSKKVSFYNNIVLRNGHAVGYLGDLSISTGSQGTIGYNCYDPGAFRANLMSPTNSYSGSTVVSAYTSLASWQAALTANGAPAGGRDANSIQSLPGFAAAGSGAAYYKITSGPCYRTGLGGVNMGAWDGNVTQIGCNFGAAPMPPSGMSAS